MPVRGLPSIGMKLSGGDSWRHAGKRVCALVTVLLLVVAVPSAGAAPGDLDSGFSSDGKLLTDIGTTDSGRAWPSSQTARSS